MTTVFDTTRRTVAEARRAPQWQRLIDSIHKAQAANPMYEGRHFGPDEERFFGLTLVGMPVSKPNWSTKNPRDWEGHWVERHQLEHRDGAITVVYRLKSLYGDDLARVYSTGDSDFLLDPTPDQDHAAALDMVKRSHFVSGRPTDA